MKFDEIKSKITEKRKELDKLREEYTMKFRKEFHSIIKAFFDDVPEVQAVVWSQYTPYFADGVPCIFSVNDRYYVTKNFDIDDRQNPYYYDDEEYASVCMWSWTKQDKPEFISDVSWEKIQEFDEVISDNEDLMEELYGDHAAVYLTKESVIVDEYDHD